MTRALVLGGGGITGIAWQIGLAYGLAESGVRLRDADLMVGTSGGSVVAAQLRSEADLDRLFTAQLEGRSREIPATMPHGGALRYLAASSWPGNPQWIRARLGRYALRAAPAAPAAERRSVIERRLPVDVWPDRPLLITAMDARTGSLRVFDAGSDVSLVDAIAASCAVPGIWPPVRIQGRWYLDAGAHSFTNADLARDCSTVLVVTPLAHAPRPADRPARQLARAGASPDLLVVTRSTDIAAEDFPAAGALDPAGTAAAAESGREQGRAEAGRIGSFWDGTGRATHAG